MKKTYIGTKIIFAEPMNKFEFYMNVKKIDCKEENEEGYKVVYPDGYVSWSPKTVFEEALLRDPANQKKYALAMALGVSKVLGLPWVTEQPEPAPASQSNIKPIIQECPVGYDEYLPGRRIIHLDTYTYISIEDGSITLYARGKQPKQLI